MDPVRSRYGSEEMKRVFDDRNRIRLMALVEAYIAETLAEFGIIPKEAAERIKEAASKISYERVKEIEKETRHETVALVKALVELSGEYGKYVHLGATSNDILDTAMALQIKEALGIIEGRLKDLIRDLCKLAKTYEDVLCVGRTHGVHAEPYTFGLKMAVFADEFLRHLERLNEIKKRVLVGKYSGALGHHAYRGPKGIEIERRLMEKLGLNRGLSTQVVPRDRLAELYLRIALVSSSLDRLATEIRNLQRTEILSVEEPFDVKKQVGSSAMPHKRNPIRMERVSGLARVLRSISLGALENIVLRHERDLTNSSFERSTLWLAFILLDQQLMDAHKVMSGLVVHPYNMRRNLDLTGGLVMSEALMKFLSEKFGRDKAHEIVRRAAMRVREYGEDFAEALSRECGVDVERIRDVMNPRSRLGAYKELIQEVLDRCKV